MSAIKYTPAQKKRLAKLKKDYAKIGSDFFIYAIKLDVDDYIQVNFYTGKELLCTYYDVNVCKIIDMIKFWRDKKMTAKKSKVAAFDDIVLSKDDQINLDYLMQKLNKIGFYGHAGIRHCIHNKFGAKDKRFVGHLTPYKKTYYIDTADLTGKFHIIINEHNITDVADRVNYFLDELSGKTNYGL
jgi:hypothetical protein